MRDITGPALPASFSCAANRRAATTLSPSCFAAASTPVPCSTSAASSCSCSGVRNTRRLDIVLTHRLLPFIRRAARCRWICSATHACVALPPAQTWRRWVVLNGMHPLALSAATLRPTYRFVRLHSLTNLKVQQCLVVARTRDPRRKVDRIFTIDDQDEQLHTLHRGQKSSRSRHERSVDHVLEVQMGHFCGFQKTEQKCRVFEGFCVVFSGNG